MTARRGTAGCGGVTAGVRLLIDHLECLFSWSLKPGGAINALGSAIVWGVNGEELLSRCHSRYNDGRVQLPSPMLVFHALRF